MRRLIDIVSSPRSSTSLFKQFEADRLDEAKAFATMMTATLNTIDEFCRDYDRSGLNLYRALQRHIEIASKLRQDRAVWFLREIRLSILREFANNVKNTFPQETNGWDAFKARVEKLYLRYLNEYQRQTGQNHEFGITATSHLSSIQHSLEHFQGVPYVKLHSYVFEMSKTWQDIKADLTEIENEFIERARGKLTLKDGDEIILQLPDNYVWVKLNRASCQDEANAMGHCGNSPRSGSGDRIISLRHIEEEIDGVQYMRPCLTFILHANGYLGEMKGRGNEKPAAHYHDAIEALLRLPMIEGIVGGGYLEKNNFSVNDLEHDRAEALLAHNHKLITPREAYERWGLNEKLMDVFKTAYETRGFIEFNRALSGIGINNEDRKKLYEMFPQPVVLYQKEGLSDRFLNQVRIGMETVENDAFDYNFETGKYKRKWFNKTDYGTHGLLVEKMTDEERKKLFTAVPLAMMPVDYYPVHGLTDEFLFDCLKGVASTGQRYFYKHGIDTMTWPAEDQAKLNTADLHELGRKLKRDVNGSFVNYDDMTPEMLASFRWWNKVHQDTGQLSLFSDLDPEVTLADKVEFAIEHWGDNAYDFPTPDENGFWKIKEWTTTEDFIEDLTESDDDARDVVKVDDFDSDLHFSVDEDDWHCENFDDILPIQWLIILGEHAAGLVLENSDHDDDYDDEEDEEDDFDPTSWREVYQALRDHDSDITDLITSSVRSAYEAGASNERYEAGQDLLKGLKPEYGELIYEGEYKTDKGTNIPFDSGVIFGMTTEQICEYFDLKFESGSMSPEEFFDVRYSHPYHGYTEYDDEAAYDRFTEDFEGYLGSLEDKAVDNPYWPNKYPENVAALDKMTAKQLKKKIAEIAKKAEGWVKITVPETDDVGELKEKLLKVAKQFYG